jgi:hypothetical protein
LRSSRSASVLSIALVVEELRGLQSADVAATTIITTTTTTTTTAA